MDRNIHLTICLSFRNEYERNLLREIDRQRRKEKKRNIAETLIGFLLQAKRNGLYAEGEIDFGGKNYSIVISQLE